MIIRSVYGTELDGRALWKYFDALVNLIFKILPMRENGEETLDVYMDSLLCELIGFKELFNAIGKDAGYLTILSILRYLKKRPDCPLYVVKREVFRAIRVCEILRERYGEA